MNPRHLLAPLQIAAAMGLPLVSRAPSEQPVPAYKVIKSEKVGGAGGWDYVYADDSARHLYVPRGDRITVYDLDSLAPVGTIPGTPSVHGVAVDQASHHAFSSSQPVAMWDSRTLEPITTIAVQGAPDGILFESSTRRIYILSHRAPNITVVDAQTGKIVGTIDIGGAPEQAASDGRGHVFVDVEDKDNVAVIDANSLQVTGHYGLAGLGGEPAGLALDADHHVLFVFCCNSNTVVILDARDGHVLSSLPIGKGVDAAEFNPATGEAFSSQGDGTLTIIKEDGPTAFHVEQTLATKTGARTSTLDRQTGHLFLATADRVATPPSTPGSRHDRPQLVPGSFTLLEVGR